MNIERLVQPVLAFSLVTFTFTLLYCKVPTENSEIIKMCLTSIISFISGSSLALALVNAAKDENTKTTTKETTDGK